MKKIFLMVLIFLCAAVSAEARDIKQSTSANVMVFMTDSTDHVSGKASLTLTITASKDGAAFGSITPTVTERGSGWYNLALTTTDTNTLGDIALHITATGADPTDIKHTIVANIEADTYAEVTNASYGLSKLVRSTTPANTLDVAATGEAGVDLSNVNGTLDAAEIGTGAITNVKFAAGAIDAAAIATDAIGAAEIAADAIGASEIAAAAITSSEFAQSAADLVWSTAARTITGGTITTNSDKTGYSLTTLESAVLHSGTAQAGAAGTITLAAGASATNDLYKGLAVKIYGGTGAGQARTITAYDGTTKVATVTWNWITNPDATSIYAVISAAHPSVNSSLQVTVGTNNDKSGYSISGTKTTLDVLNDISAATVWGYSTRTLTSGGYSGLTATDIDNVWEYDKALATGVSAIGKHIVDNLNATVSSRSTLTDAAVWSYVTRTLTSGGYSGLTAADVDLIWDEPKAGHVTAATYGLYLDKAISAVDDNPWDNTTRTLTSNVNFNDPTAAAIADAVWDELLADHVLTGSTGKKLGDLPVSGTGDWTSGEKTLIKQALGINDGDVDAGGDLDSIFMEIRRTRGR